MIRTDHTLSSRTGGMSDPARPQSVMPGPTRGAGAPVHAQQQGQITALGQAIRESGMPFVLLGGLPGMPLKLPRALHVRPAANR